MAIILKSLCLFVLCFAACKAEFKKVCGLLPAEFVFLLDSSGSEGERGFKQQTKFVANFTSQLDIGPNNTQVAAVTFSTGVHNNFFLNTYQNKTQLINSINQIKYLNGETETSLGLNFVSSQSLAATHGARPGFKKYVVVLTDGKSRDGHATITAANKLHNMPNVTVIAIGIGQAVDLNELKAIATDQQHVFTVSNFDLLPTLQKELEDKTCTTCGDMPLDLAYLLDSSGSEGPINFQRQLDFISLITNEFNIARNDTQIATVSFSTYAYPGFYLHDHLTKMSVLEAIQKIPYQNGETMTDLGLSLLGHSVFSIHHGSRGDAKDIAIVITDGRSNEPDQTIRAAHRLHSMGIEVFVVGIGHHVDKRELQEIATDNRHVFLVPDFHQLDTIHNTIVASICKERVRPPTTTAAPTTPTTTTTTTLPTTTVKPECGPKPADIVFVLDSSESEKAENFAKQVNFVYEFARKFKVGRDNVQFSSVTFSSNVRNDFFLNTYSDRHHLLNAIRNISYMGAGTNTSAALKFVRENSFLPKNGGRANATHIAIVITDGQSSNPSETAKEAAALHHVADKVFSIGVGTEIDQHELQTIGSNNHVFTVNNFDILHTIEKTLIDAACN